MTTLLGWTPMGTDEPFDLSRWTRSTWITHFLRYTCVTLPSRPLYFPRTILTSSSLRIGSDRVYDDMVRRETRVIQSQKEQNAHCACLGAPLKEPRTLSCGERMRAQQSAPCATCALKKRHLYTTKAEGHTFVSISSCNWAIQDRSIPFRLIYIQHA